MQELVKIIVAHHKPGLVISDDVHLPVQVGAALAQTKLDMQGDDTGDNISAYNPIYCEMTAAYWAWKNLPESVEYIGLCHYRRYFTIEMPAFGAWLKDWADFYKAATLGRFTHPEVNRIHSDQLEMDGSAIIRSSSDFASHLKSTLCVGDVDVVVPRKSYLSSLSLKSFFSGLSSNYIVKVLLETVNHIAPDLYPYLMDTMSHTSLYAANMFVMKRGIFCSYCETVFSVLSALIERIEKEGWCMDASRERCFARMAGYMSELLTNAFLQMVIANGAKKVQYNTSLMV